MALVDPPWFARRRIGWGLSPARWQGWLATAIFANLARVCALFFAHDAAALCVAIVLLVVVFVALAVLTGESPGHQPRRR